MKDILMELSSAMTSALKKVDWKVDAMVVETVDQSE